MARPLYLEDSYLREFDATVQDVQDGTRVVLDQTAFYAAGGGQPNDTGTLVRGGEEFKVVSVAKADGAIVHTLDRPGLAAGDKVRGAIDWQRRHALMRMHTSAHIVMQVLHDEMGALGTGNQLDVDKSRIDFSLESYDPALLERAIAKANEVIARDLPVSVRFMTREEAMRIPGITKLAMGLPEHIQDVRIVAIGDFDVQADGGTHVRSTREIGRVEFLKAENKGSTRRRMYFSLRE